MRNTDPPSIRAKRQADRARLREGFREAEAASKSADLATDHDAAPIIPDVGASDLELPGMWEASDFTGGQDEVRPPAPDPRRAAQERAAVARAARRRKADERLVRDLATRGWIVLDPEKAHIEPTGYESRGAAGLMTRDARSWQADATSTGEVVVAFGPWRKVEDR